MNSPETPTTNGDIALLYIAALVPALIAALAVAQLAIWLIWLAPHSIGTAFSWSLSVAPSFIIYRLVGRRILSHVAPDRRGGVVGHLLRSASMYVCFFVSAGLLLAAATSGHIPDLGLSWQVFVWPSGVGFGGIVADATVAFRDRRSKLSNKPFERAGTNASRPADSASAGRSTPLR
jgi:hypothetical protein